MSKNEENRIEAEIENLSKTAEMMNQKELQMRKFLKNSFSMEVCRDNSLAVKRMHQFKEISEMLNELGQEKDTNPELLEFYLMFEDMKETFGKTLEKEKIIRQNYNEIITGMHNQSEWC
jgi:hypothetical protein